MAPSVPPRHPAVIIAGMHRSGTSLTASLIADAGVHLGDDLLGPSHGNRAGHFEDRQIYEFHQRALAANGLGLEGFTSRSACVVPDGLLPEARLLVEHRRRHDGPWGWKEPRTTLFLDFWADLIPEARFLLVFRRPWEVVDSLFRRGDPTFVWNPQLAIDIWQHYNQELEQFQGRHPDRCVLVELADIVADPRRCFARVSVALGVDLGTPSDRFQNELLTQDAASARGKLLAACDAEVIAVYRRLQQLAESKTPLAEDFSPQPGQGDVAGSLIPLAVAEWRRATAAEADAAGLRADLVHERAERNRLTTALQSSRHETDVARAFKPQLEALTAAHAAAHATIETLTRDCESLRKTVEQLEGQRTEAEACHQAAVATHQRELQTAADRLAAGTAALAAITADRDRIRQTTETLQQQLDAARGQASSWETAAHNARAAHAQIQSDHDQRGDELLMVRHELAAALERLSHKNSPLSVKLRREYHRVRRKLARECRRLGGQIRRLGSRRRSGRQPDQPVHPPATAEQPSDRRAA